jgi:hypothetical protein
LKGASSFVGVLRAFVGVITNEPFRVDAYWAWPVGEKNTNRASFVAGDPSMRFAALHLVGMTITNELLV